MKFVALTRIPFGSVLVNPDAVGMVIPADADPGADQQHGCCLLIQGEEVRVKEKADEVLALFQPPVEQILADPEPGLPSPEFSSDMPTAKSTTMSTKKGKKK